MRDLHGKVAFVTGGASGIGLGIAKALACAGADLALTYLLPQQLPSALDELRAAAPGCRIHPICLDVTDRMRAQAAAAEAVGVFGRLHVACNAAGVNVFNPVDEATFEDWDWVLGVNLQGAINVLVSTLPYIKRHGEGGHVINVGSMSSFIAGPAAGVYTTSKFALRGLSESLRYSLVRHGIGISLVCPGLTRTSIFEAPLNRPANLAREPGAHDLEIVERLRRVHEAGMDPDEVGRITIRAIERNAFYVFPHPEFRDELRADAEEVIAAFPCGEAPPKRLAFEEGRRKLKADIQARMRASGQP
jgi:NAD(P)-dependent dehydrogenase (short-subunit alcohol dehydrogenase family)